MLEELVTIIPQAETILKRRQVGTPPTPDEFDVLKRVRFLALMICRDPEFPRIGEFSA
jgi:hypothetical protein